MPDTPPFVEFLFEQFSPLGRITARHMMGGWVLYCEGAVFALVADNALYLKADKLTIPAFEACGLQAFRPFPDKELTMKYYQAPPEVFDNADAMRQWVGGAVETGRRAAKRPRKRAAKR